ncbi:GNAT family N-acetyltransferase [Cytobacillus depressus]|uniref:GNAT family N-acetyltransferase n=1 Tax=Cytobacillus depressus TaxID=1602942 RepID=A0A6L3V398_9BACI|nr:GNAT family N-acetyltransferase [Cytobacillus depressus]KAB2334458.1 GNAT family N-acetyltransferase [Cytobacillus depressus]
MIIRLAESKDIEQLIRMRWDVTIESYPSKSFDESEFDSFQVECEDFLNNAIKGDRWFIWIAEEEGKIVSHIYIELIEKVPRPGSITRPFAFMTNVYTVKDFRNKGVGSQLLTAINEWAKKEQYEFIIVWPSDESVNYYKKNGYSHCKEPMEYFPS